MMMDACEDEEDDEMMEVNPERKRNDSPLASAAKFHLGRKIEAKKIEIVKSPKDLFQLLQ